MRFCFTFITQVDAALSHCISVGFAVLQDIRTWSHLRYSNVAYPRQNNDFV